MRSRGVGSADGPGRSRSTSRPTTFLIDKGFSPELGARPLKRALERHLLAPIAAAIVEQEVPEGDQFLFVTASGGEADRRHLRRPGRRARSRGRRRRRAGTGRPPRARALAAGRRGFGPLRPRRAGPRPGRGRGAAGAEGPRPLGDVGARVLGSGRPLRRSSPRRSTSIASPRRRGSRNGSAHGSRGARARTAVARRISLRSWPGVSTCSTAPSPGSRRVGPRRSSSASGPRARRRATEGFADQIADMYAGWAKRRGMRLQRLDSPGEHLFAVSGLGCGEILEAESGLHVLEQVDEERDGERIVDREQIRVQVVRRAARPRARPGLAEAAGDIRARRGRAAGSRREALPAGKVPARARRREGLPDGQDRPRSRGRLRPLLRSVVVAVALVALPVARVPRPGRRCTPSPPRGCRRSISLRSPWTDSDRSSSESTPSQLPSAKRVIREVVARVRLGERA